MGIGNYGNINGHLSFIQSLQVILTTGVKTFSMRQSSCPVPNWTQTFEFVVVFRIPSQPGCGNGSWNKEETKEISIHRNKKTKHVT